LLFFWNIVFRDTEVAEAHEENLDQTLSVEGVKQFEPTGSRQTIEHVPHAHGERKSLKETEVVHKSVATWFPDRNVAEVTHRVGTHFQTVGTEKNKVIVLQAEEALFMIENVRI
jgi:hypothetical protein